MQEEMGSPERDPPADVQPEPIEDPALLNTYKWHTGGKQHPDGSKGDGGATGSSERPEKSTPSKWSKMQNWRKALSEDTPERREAAGHTENPKPSKGPTARKNPFRRALSEPPGSLLAIAPTSPVAPPSPGPSSTETPTSSPQDAQQKGGGAIFRKYLRTVSQKFKKPRLQSRNSTPLCQDDTGGNEALGSVPAPIPAPATLAEPVRLSWSPPQDVPVWDINNCQLQDGQIFISREDEVRPMMTRNISTHLPAALALIKRRFQGAALRKSNTQINVIGNNGGRLHDSRESLSIPVSAVESLDLSSDQTTVIRPVHSSILGEKYCFEDNCERTENSLSVWVNEAKDLPPKRRYYCELHLDNTLFARTTSRAVEKSTNRSSTATDGGAAASGGALGGAGSSSGGGCQLFWGEFFELDNLPPVSQLTLHLFRDDEPKKKRHSKDDSSLYPLGSVAISLADIRGRAFQEKWYQIVPYKLPGSGGTKDQLGSQAFLRVKARFQNLKVLPIERYKEFAEFVTMNYEVMCVNLEPLLPVREKEELAGALVHVLQSIGKAKEFLITLGSREVQRCGEKEALIFRENTLATKAIDEYMKLVGQKYLIDTLGDFITRLYASTESCEVDPRKCTASDLQNNQRHLREGCEDVAKRITEMNESFPVELNEIFSSWMEECEGRGRVEIGQRLISASLFLRFLCPAILSPSLFGLTQPYPDPPTLRALTLTAKVIQNLANFTLFGEKEEYMLFMNDFLQQHWENMRGFLQRVSNPDSELAMSRFDGYVDLPLRLAVLHGLLVDIISPMEQETIDKLHPLPSILNQITDSLGPNAPRITLEVGFESVIFGPKGSCSNYFSTRTEQSKPDYVPPRGLAEYSPLHNSVQQLTTEPGSKRKRVMRTQSVPDRVKPHKRTPKRQASSENLTLQDTEQDIHITSPHPRTSAKLAAVPWYKDINNRESYQIKTEQEEINILEKHEQELLELRTGVDQVTERELEMAKRLEDFIVQSQDQNAMLEAKVQELQNMLAMRDEQLASAMFRLGVIEEEREEDERKLNVAMAAAERMNVLEKQFADLLKDKCSGGNLTDGGQRNTQISDTDTCLLGNSQ
ncbi:RAS protein activator like-3-like [Scleropages formosus]|uniref:RAS protein activator like-3-like n=1 Tax=Scleropages formosus TaxID=113540 RepID=A0A0N8K043_SCLFO|nr:RAS protein activator like-3-like [Scleropages formosus]